MKTCTKCGSILPAILDNFHRNKEGKDGLNPVCKKCCTEKRKQYYIENSEKCRGYARKWRENLKNKLLRSEYDKKYHINNRESILERHIQYRQENIEIVLAQERKYRNKNREKLNKRQRERSTQRYQTVKNDPKKSLSLTISNAIRQSLVNNKNGHHWENLVNFTVDDLKKHLEKQFKLGMTWENHGKWHIDHKVPVSAFNFKSHKDLDFKRCWALSNLQPLWAEENLSKNAKLDKPFQPSLAFGGCV